MSARQVRVLRADDRFRSERSGISTTHEFSFGDHYDPERTSFGALMVHNVETLQPGSGYSPHTHRDVEIVTWVVSGALEHNDDHGHAARLLPGTVQRLTAAGGVTHSEVNATRGSAGSATQFVQMWLRCPAEDLAPGEGPSYELGVVDSGKLRGGLVALASGRTEGVGSPVVSLRSPGVTLWGAQVRAGESRRLPEAPLLHLHVVQGALRLHSGESAGAGDSLTIANSDAGELAAYEDAQLLVLTMDRTD
jgi:redox-sensitive bicupin YhaK (pirin superfamily)